MRETKRPEEEEKREHQQGGMRRERSRDEEKRERGPPYLRWHGQQILDIEVDLIYKLSYQEITLKKTTVISLS